MYKKEEYAETFNTFAKQTHIQTHRHTDTYLEHRLPPLIKNSKEIVFGRNGAS